MRHGWTSSSRGELLRNNSSAFSLCRRSNLIATSEAIDGGWEGGPLDCVLLVPTLLRRSSECQNIELY